MIDTDFTEDEVNGLRIALAQIARLVHRHVESGEMTRTQQSVLGTIVRTGPLGVSELADVEGLNPTMLSRVLGQFVARGLIERLADQADRRAVTVRATEAGRTLHLSLRAERTELFRAHLRELPPAQAARLRKAVPALELLADLMREPVPA